VGKRSLALDAYNNVMSLASGHARRGGPWHLTRCVTVLTCAAVLIAGCSGSGASTPLAASSASKSDTPLISATPQAAGKPQPIPSGSASPHRSPTLPEQLLPSSPAPPHLADVRWSVSTLSASGIPLTAVARLDGGSVGLLWMNSVALHFRLIPGYQVPESSPVRTIDRSASSWVPRMVAAFNGGFRLSDHRGGYFYAGTTVSPLVPGLGSLMVLADGQIQIGSWGGAMKLSSHTLAVRQELPLLVSNYQSMANSSQSADYWGRTNGGLPTANRSALGQRADGTLVYAEGSEITPLQLASALIRVGVRQAMVLDMNKSWPNAFVYTTQGHQHTGMKVQRGMWRDPSIYYRRFTKDFIVAEAR
jgi:hypothetical protein